MCLAKYQNMSGSEAIVKEIGGRCSYHVFTADALLKSSVSFTENRMCWWGVVVGGAGGVVVSYLATTAVLTSKVVRCSKKRTPCGGVHWQFSGIFEGCTVLNDHPSRLRRSFFEEIPFGG